MILPYDVYHFWAAGLVARTGGNPYLVEAISPIMLANGWPIDERVFGFLHPFWSLWLFCALSLMPLEVARLVSEVTIVALCVFSVLLLTQRQERSVLGISAPRAFLLFATAIFPPFMSTIFNGQTTALLLFGIVVWLRCTVRRQLFSAGIALTLTTIKFQLFLPFYVYVLLSQWRQSNVKVIGGFLLGMLAQAALSLLFAPESAAFWLSAAATKLGAAASLPTPSFARIIAGVVGVERVDIGLLLLALALSVWASRYTKMEVIPTAVFIFLPLSLLVTPYTWTHGFLALLPAYLSLVSRLWTYSRQWAPYPLIAFAALGALEVVMPVQCAVYMVVVPLCVLGFGLLVVGRGVVNIAAE